MPKKLQELQIPAGFVDGTPRQVKSRWIRGNHVRFRDGRLRPIGGWTAFPLSNNSEQLDSSVRGHHQWRNNLGVGLMALATAGESPAYGKLYAMEITVAEPFTDTASTSTGSAQITVTSGALYEVGDRVSGSGIPSATVTAVSGNTVTLDTTANASASVSVTVTPSEARQRLVEITPTGYQATGDAVFRPGYGYYYYGGDYEYGTTYAGAGSTSYSRTAHWSLDNFGQNLIGCHSGYKKIFYWEGDVGEVGGDPDDIRAQVISTANGFEENAPTAVSVLVTQERHVLALGADGDLRSIRWSSQESVDVWQPDPVNTAGDLPLQTTGFIVCGRSVQGGVLIWTDTDVHQLTYLGPPLVYGIQKLADNAGALSPYAIHSSSEITTWVNREGFWIYDGYARPLPSPIQDRVMRTVDWSQEGLIYAGGNSEFGEVWWFFPSKTGTAGQCEYYVIYNYRDNVWCDSFANSGISRNAWIDKQVLNAPIAVDSSASPPQIYLHEVRTSAQTETAEAETGALDVMQGERYSRISKIYTDSEQDVAGSVNYRFYTSPAADADEVESAAFPLEADGEIDVRLQGRQIRYSVSGSLARDWTVGNTRFETHIGGRR